MSDIKKYIFLVGARASGKSTVAAILASALACPYIDTDMAFVAHVGADIQSFVSKHGWDAFRRQESACLRRVCADATDYPYVVATGGGMVLAEENRLFMRKQGLVCYLHAPASVLITRLRRVPEQQMRPALSTLAFEDEVTHTVTVRDPLYRQAAHAVFDATLPVDTLTAHIVEQYQKHM